MSIRSVSCSIVTSHLNLDPGASEMVPRSCYTTIAFASDRSTRQRTAAPLIDHQNRGGAAVGATDLMPSHISLFTVRLPTESSFTVQMVS